VQDIFENNILVSSGAGAIKNKDDKKNCVEYMIHSDVLKKDILHYVESRPTATTLVCKHIQGEVPLGELFTDKVFTQEILKELDEKVIKPTFMLPSIESLDDLAEITKELEEIEDEGDIEGEDKN